MRIGNMPNLEEIAKKKSNFKKKEFRPYNLTGDIEPKAASNKLKNIDATNESKPITNEDSSINKTETYSLKAISSRGRIIEVSPNECQPWDFADRGELEMGDISELAKSIKANGQQEPVLIREIKKPDDNIKYEVIFGHRRWKACLLCEQPLFAIIKNISDKDAAIAQKEENQNRENLSDYARAFNYKKLLDSNVFKTQSELAAHLGIPKNTLAVLLNYTKIPKQILNAMKTPHYLPQRTATKLAQLTSDITPEELQRVCEIAPGFVNGQISYKNISPSLWSDEKNLFKSNEEIKTFDRRSIKNKLNIPLFTAGLNQNKVPSITFSKVVIENNLYDEVVELVESFLRNKTENG